jgi:hypothetical protein
LYVHIGVCQPASYSHSHDIWTLCDHDALRVLVYPNLSIQFAYITAIDPEENIVTVDFAEWYSEEAPEVAAIENGAASEDCTVDGGFYIRNNNDRLRDYAVASPLGTPFVIYVCYPTR